MTPAETHAALCVVSYAFKVKQEVIRGGSSLSMYLTDHFNCKYSVSGLILSKNSPRVCWLPSVFTK